MKKSVCGFLILLFLKVLILCFARYCICSAKPRKDTGIGWRCLASVLNSPEFCQVEFDFKEVLAEEPLLIQYENEFYLINANSMSNNSNELTNLKEVNDELVVKINDLKRKIDSLQATHSEISDQSEQYTKDLSEAEIENQKLLKRQAELQEKYQNLTMAENLSNTIKSKSRVFSKEF